MFKFQKFLAISFVVLFCLILNSGVSHAEPKIQFNETTYDFGEIEQQTSRKHTFVFKNAGDAELEIREVKPSCGCTAALLSSKIIKPGESGQIEVTFNSGAFKNAVKKTVHVETNEKVNPVKELSFTAFVKYDATKEAALQRAREEAYKKNTSKALEVAPKAQPGAPTKPSAITAVSTSSSGEPAKVVAVPNSINLGVIKLNTEYKKSVTLNAQAKGEFNIKEVKCQIPYVAIMINKLNIAPNSPGELEVTVNVKKAGTLKSGIIYVYLAGEPKPIEILIMWEVK